MFIWKPEYNTGVPQIDAQHKQVFAIAGELHAAMVAGADRTALGAILARLLSCSRTHFDSEEDLMQTSGYPGYAQHKAEHDALTGQVRTFQQNFDAGRAEMTPELVQFLNGWLTHHITDPDRKMASHVRFFSASSASPR